MKKIQSLLLLLAMSFGTLARAESIEPQDCQFFTALAATGNRNSTDSAAFNKPFNMIRMRHGSFFLKWTSLTGSVDSVFKVQETNDPAYSSWVDVSSATFTLTGASGFNQIDVASFDAKYYRVVFTKNSVTGGTLNGYCVAKSP